MENKKWTRREVIGSIAGIPLTASLELMSFSNIIQKNSNAVRCKLLNKDGELYDEKKMGRFYICDLQLSPFRIDPQFSPGEIVFIPEIKPFRISLPVEVPGFGEVFLYADNLGKGYTAKSLEETGVLFLNYEFAADRLATVKRIAEECKKAGLTLSSGTQKRIDSSGKFLIQAKASGKDEKAAAKWAMESLRESLYAGEMAVIERAEHAIEKRGSRPGFLFGCNSFRFRDADSPYSKAFTSLFNFATLPFYHGSIEKVKGQPDYSRVDVQLKALQNTNIIYKGHPLIFLTPGVTPDWAKNKTPGEIIDICLKYIRTTIQKYRGRIHIWDVVNEAHVQPDMDYGKEEMIKGYTKENAVELSCAAAKAARETDPTCFRVINSTGTWTDYYMGRNPAPWQQSVYDYLKMLGSDVGLQYYHSGRDLLEFERNIESFSGFNKPIHITELQIPSSSSEVKGADWWGGGVGGSRFPWHGSEFTETIQADWVEGIYKILYSKPYIDAITWWDLSDPAFVPHGGMLNSDMSPKESYNRLKSLLDKWKMV